MERDSMLVGRRRHLAVLQLVVSRTGARGSHAMLRDADQRRVSRSGSGHNADSAELCCDDRRTDSSVVGSYHVTC
jgi:hypothetical protein